MANLLLAIIYLAFISLGLPDGLLGAAWPSMYGELGVPVSYAGLVSIVIALGTIVSSLLSDRLTLKLGTGRVTAFSVLITCLALFGFSFCKNYPMLILMAIPYGLGAGGVDAALNNYVAIHYTSRHMSWLHCMWGVGAAAGPYLMGWALTGGHGWGNGYRYVGFIQVALVIILFVSLRLWRKRPDSTDGEKPVRTRPLKFREIVSIPGAKSILIAFFCYCAIETTVGLWAASFLNISKGVSPTLAANMASVFYIGITVGRAVNGFLTMKFSDTTLIRLGQGIILLGVIILFLPLSYIWSLGGIVLIGLGCAPIYPCIIHSTPAHFGEENSQALVGVQMASAYSGTLLMPPVFGLLGQNINMGIFPIFILIILIIMIIMTELHLKKYKIKKG